MHLNYLILRYKKHYPIYRNETNTKKNLILYGNLN